MTNPTGLASTLAPPYYAVIFTSIRTDGDDGYDDLSARMVQLASTQPGFLGVESARDGALGITISYWASEEALLDWKRNIEHREAQRGGRDRWYSRFQVRVARVERDYGFARDSDEPESVAR